MAVDCALAVLSRWRWHHSVPALTVRSGFPRGGVTVTGPGETAGRSRNCWQVSPGTGCLLWCKHWLKRGERAALFLLLLPLLLHCCSFLSLLGKHFSKNISLVIQSLPHLPNLPFIQEHQRCPVITTCMKGGKQLESNPLYLFYTVPSGFGTFVPCFLLLVVFSQHKIPRYVSVGFCSCAAWKTQCLQWCYLLREKIAGLA